MSTQYLNETELVYGELGDQLVFIPRGTAERLAYLWSALGKADTWGEFLRMLEACPPLLTQFKEYWQAYYDDGSRPIPAVHRTFYPDEIPGHADGDWPAWPAQDMIEWMPRDLQKEWGRRVSSIFNGFFLELDPGDERAIVAALTQRGYSCFKDPELVRRASGH